MLIMPEVSNSKTELPKRLVWNSHDAAECADITKKLAEYLHKGFTVEELSVGDILLNPPAESEDVQICRVLDPTGDTRLVWNRNILSEITEARKKFDDYLRLGYRAYVCRQDGKKGSKVDSFDALLEELIVDKTNPSSGLLVPSTKPG
jgi:hypothetical protein